MMDLSILLLVASSLPHVEYVPQARRENAIAKVVEAVEKDGPLPLELRSIKADETELDEARKRATASLGLVFAFFESVWDESAMGDCNDPKKRTETTCRSFGYMQTNRLWFPYGVSVEQVRKDGVLSFRIGFAAMRKAIAKCGGNVKAGLGLYASGMACGAAEKLVAKRCKLAGLGEDCRQ